MYTPHKAQSLPSRNEQSFSISFVSLIIAILAVFIHLNTQATRDVHHELQVSKAVREHLQYFALVSSSARDTRGTKQQLATETQAPHAVAIPGVVIEESDTTITYRLHQSYLFGKFHDRVTKSGLDILEDIAAFLDARTRKIEIVTFVSSDDPDRISAWTQSQLRASALGRFFSDRGARGLIALSTKLLHRENRTLDTLGGGNSDLAIHFRLE